MNILIPSNRKLKKTAIIEDRSFFFDKFSRRSDAMPIMKWQL